jgi:hypothetical protein
MVRPRVAWPLGGLSASADLSAVVWCAAGEEGRRAVRHSFCLHMREMMVCSGCGQASPNPPRDYDTNIFYVPVRSLMEVREADTAGDPGCLTHES